MVAKPHGSRILHVSEAWGGGVASAIETFISNTPEFEHHLAYSPKTQHAVADELPNAIASSTLLPAGHIARISAIRRLVRALAPDVVHAHSSFAGVYVRVALRKSRGMRLVYTPHCYAFERRDVGSTRRALFRAVEWCLSLNTSVFAAVSPRELTLSAWPLSRAERVLVPNATTVEEIPIDTLPPRDAAPLRIAGAGRLDPQKDPAMFLETVRTLRSHGIDVGAVWIGGANREWETELRANGVRVTGWVRRDDALRELGQVDLYYHTGAWEAGPPLVVLDASALGIPVVARGIPAYDGVALPALINSPAEFVARWNEFSKPQARGELRLATRQALAGFSRAQQRRGLLKAWNTDTRGTDES